MPWLSIIIPLYNCEPYITMCLNSVLQQGLEEDEYEVIVVNDGSTDDGAKIVSEYCKKHTNFHLINKENGGVSSARNRGMDEAQGEYVYFMDADDRLIPNGMRTLYDSYLATSRPDTISFWSRIVDKFYDVEKWEYIHPHKELFRGTLADFVNTYGFNSTAWCNLFSRAFLVRQGIRFEQLSYCEDILFMNKCLMVEDGMVIATSLNIYRYCVREGSASTTRTAERINECYSNFMLVCRKIEELSHNAKYKIEMFEKEINHLKVVIFIRFVYGVLSYEQTREMLQRARKDGFYPILHCETRLHRLINFFTKSSFSTYLLSKIVKYIYLPYIKPRLHSN